MPAPMLSTVQRVAAQVVFVTLRQGGVGPSSMTEQGAAACSDGPCWQHNTAQQPGCAGQPSDSAVHGRREQQAAEAAMAAHLLLNSPIQLSKGPTLQSTVLLAVGRPSRREGEYTFHHVVLAPAAQVGDRVGGQGSAETG